MNRTRLTPLGRLVAMVMLLTFGAVAGAAGAAATRPHAREWRCVQVRPGDTLWALADGASEDPRATVHRIMTHNELAGAQIRPGMAVWVPVEAGGDAPETRTCATVD